MPKLANLNEMDEFLYFFVFYFLQPSNAEAYSKVDLLSFLSLFHLILHQTVKFQFSLGLNPPTYISLEGLTPFLLFSLFFFELASSFRSKWYLMCKEERQ